MKKGIFAVYKPKGPTSNDIIQIIKKKFPDEKVGHAGTLDPLACGVLVVAVGRDATKKLSEEVAKEKEYVAKIRLGMNSKTDDEEGEKEVVDMKKKVKAKDIKKVIKKFKGQIWQTPPIYSAIKIKGQEAYKYARAGKKVVLEKRKVEIKKIKILKYKWPFLKIKVVTGPGVYIRSLARDIGKELKCGGYLSELERTRVGEFKKRKAIKLKKIKKLKIRIEKQNHKGTKVDEDTKIDEDIRKRKNIEILEQKNKKTKKQKKRRTPDWLKVVLILLITLIVAGLAYATINFGWLYKINDLVANFKK